MKRRYDEVMDKIEVTDEMRRRILSNLQKMDLAAAVTGRTAAISRFKRFLPAAACFALLLAGVLAAGHITGMFQPDEPNAAVANGIVEVDTLQALSAAVGFEAEELEALPFGVETVVYASYWNELAEITYSGEGKTAVFRKSPGTGDNSGDYNSYPSVRESDMGALSVTLKGSGEVYTLAVWRADGYAYSIRLSDGISEPEWQDLICG